MKLDHGAVCAPAPLWRRGLATADRHGKDKRLCVGRSVCRRCLGYAAFNPAAHSSEEPDTTAELGPIRAATTRSIPCASARARAIRVAVRASVAETFSCHGACVLGSRPTMR